MGQAIDWAVNEWKVDIISMSFGFTSNRKELEDAVKRAANDDVLMFAAASNHGDNRGYRAYPARDRNVFCIHSTDWQGNRSKFNPRYERGDDNFSTLGENVRSAWTGNGERSLSGTSVATPIAAAFAALVLEFVRQPEIPGQMQIPHLDRLETYTGMRAVFRLLRGADESFVYLAPWKLLSTDYPRISPTSGGNPDPLAEIREARDYHRGKIRDALWKEFH